MRDGPPVRLTSTTFQMTGATTDDQFREIWVEVAKVRDIGAIAFELAADGTASMIIKHKVDVEPDWAAVAAAVRSAGDYDLRSPS